MEQIKKVWMGLDWFNRILLVAGIVLAVIMLVMKKGFYGVVCLFLFFFMIISRNNDRKKKSSRKYGTMFFHMPDGELVPLLFEQIKSEYLHKQGAKYNGRTVSIQFPVWTVNSTEIDTGFGLMIDAAGSQDESMVKGLRRGDYIAVTGTVVSPNREYFYIGEVTDLRRTGEENIFFQQLQK